MKVSVFVPCMMSHWTYLPKMICEYISGTVKPDEIVICLSGADVLPDREKEMFKRKYYGKVRLVTFDEHLYAGPARQKALELRDTDIIMFHDADDCPQRKGVEVVKYFFD